MTDLFASTVAALSTPPGKGGVALIRISGKHALPITDRVFRAKNGRPLADAPSRMAIYGHVYADGEMLDDVLATCFRAPHSYTGEDTVEITCHGGMLICRTLLEALFAAGASPAGPGEFTRRAFLSGRLGLSEAEAIGELLDAKSREQIKLFQADSRSKLSQVLSDCYETLSSLLSAIYAKIDYPDEDLAEWSREEIIERLSTLGTSLQRLKATYRTGRAIAEGIPTVLLGKPNTGKSSLYNLLLGKQAAIVTEYAGTTRDILQSTVPLGRVLLRLTDTAGVRDTADPIEQIGVDRAKQEATSASLLLLLFDTSRPFDQEDAALLAYADTLSGTKIALLNKCDQPPKWGKDLLQGHASHIISFCTAEGESQTAQGLHVLKELVEAAFTDGQLQVGEDAIVTSARQYTALGRATEFIDSAHRALQDGIPFDAALSDLELAMAALGEIDGRQVSEDIVSGIFSKFCVGK